jgi:hypothetical protein
VGQDRTAVVGAFGVPSVACNREKAGNEGPVLALCGPDRSGGRCSLLRAKRTSQLRTQTSEFDPNVWSGRALQEDFNELAVSGLASMYPAFGWRRCSGPSWISARL